LFISQQHSNAGGFQRAVDVKALFVSHTSIQCESPSIFCLCKEDF
jgi:hypothetical protein